MVTLCYKFTCGILINFSTYYTILSTGIAGHHVIASVRSCWLTFLDLAKTGRIWFLPIVKTQRSVCQKAGVILRVFCGLFLPQV